MTSVSKLIFSRFRIHYSYASRRLFTVENLASGEIFTQKIVPRKLFTGGNFPPVADTSQITQAQVLVNPTLTRLLCEKASHYENVFPSTNKFAFP